MCLNPALRFYCRSTKAKGFACLDENYRLTPDRRWAFVSVAVCGTLGVLVAGCHPWSSAQLDSAAAQLKADDSLHGDIAAQLNSSKSGERRAALQRLANPQAGRLPENITRFASDPDRSVRCAAVTTLAARRHPEAIELLRHAVDDSDSSVRLAAVAGFGVVGGREALAELQRLTKSSSESIRAAAYRALIERHDPDALAGAASDKAANVRSLAAAALRHAEPSPREIALAGNLAADRNLDVAKQSIDSVSRWSLRDASPVLLTAMEAPAYEPRKLAAEQLAARWPPATSFEVDASADRRAKLIAELRDRWRAEFPAKSIMRPEFRPDVGQPEPAEADERLPALIEQLSSSDERERRRAADGLRDAYRDKRLPDKALERLAEMMTSERDALVLISVFELLAGDARDPATQLAYAALSHPAPEVRRRACDHLAEHPDRRHATALTASLGDESPAVVEAAVKALGRLRAIDSPKPLERLLAHEDHLLRVAAAAALAGAGYESGVAALERLMLDADPRVRHAAAAAGGQSPNETPR